MKVSARHKNARMTPRKVRQIRGVVVGLPVAQATAQLAWQPGKAAELVGKVLSSAVANAKENFEIAEDNLRVLAVDVDDGMRLKRFQPASRGTAHRFVKRSCHIRVVVEEIKVSKKERVGKKTEIQTVSVEELAAGGEVPQEKVGNVSETDTGVKAKPEAEMKASGKVKVLQRGGDKKTKQVSKKGTK